MLLYQGNITVQETLNTLWPKEIAHIFQENHFDEEQIEKIKNLIIFSAFQIDLFPYELKFVPLRHYLFEQKFSLSFPNRIIEFNLLLRKISNLIDVKLSYRHSVIFHFVVVEELLNTLKEDEKVIYVYSDLGEKHINYLLNKVKVIIKSINQKARLEKYTEKKVIKKNEFLVTNSRVPLISIKNQIVIDDYLSFYDQLVLERLFSNIL